MNYKQIPFFLTYIWWEQKKSPFYSHLVTRVEVEKGIKFNHVADLWNVMTLMLYAAHSFHNLHCCCNQKRSLLPV